MSPEMAEIIKWLITTLLTVVSVYIAVSNFNRSRTASDRAEVDERARREARTDAKLDEAIQLSRDTKDSVAELRHEIRSHNDRIVRMEERLKSLADSYETLSGRVSTAEKRIDLVIGGDSHE